MALNAYLKLTGQKQGIIKGSVTQKGRENTMEVIAFNHEVLSPRDAASGLATGKRQHKPLTITKLLDKSTPLLMQVLTTNESITAFELQFFTTQKVGLAGGTEKNYYTIRLTNASIIDIRTTMLNNKNLDLVKYETYEEVSFVYDKIEWVWTDGGVTTSDVWISQA